MRYLISPTALKGSFSATQTARAIEATLLAQAADAQTLCLPLADGGTDTLAVLAYNQDSLRCYDVLVTGPLANTSVMAQYGLLSEQEAVIEAAQAHGLPLLTTPEPMNATSYGVGQLIRAVLDQNPAVTTLTVTLGGSASTDGGLGALQALGVVFCDHAGREILETINGALLAEIAAIRWSACRFPDRIKLEIITDVQNPLLGISGTARVFAPQKGASTAQLDQLERELSRIAQLMKTASGIDHSQALGAGAAGGLGYGLLHLPHAKITSGFDWLSQRLKLSELLTSVDCIITAEGCFDDTSLSGKVTGSLIKQSQGKPVVILCGENRCTQALSPSVQVIVFPMSQSEAMANPQEAIRLALNQFFSAK